MYIHHVVLVKREQRGRFDLRVNLHAYLSSVYVGSGGFTVHTITFNDEHQPQSKNIAKEGKDKILCWLTIVGLFKMKVFVPTACFLLFKWWYYEPIKRRTGAVFLSGWLSHLNPTTTKYE